MNYVGFYERCQGVDQLRLQPFLAVFTGFNINEHVAEVVGMAEDLSTSPAVAAAAFLGEPHLDSADSALAVVGFAGTHFAFTRHDLDFVGFDELGIIHFCFP
jgi:hypothetical protein